MEKATSYDDTDYFNQPCRCFNCAIRDYYYAKKHKLECVVDKDGKIVKELWIVKELF